MNLKNLKIVVTLSVSVYVSSALALTESVNGITWKYAVSRGEASVGAEGAFSSAVPYTTTGAIVIPLKLGGYNVTSIGDYAFYSCSGLTSMTIPNSVTNIGAHAFDWCGGLTNIAVSTENSEYKSVNGLLLSKDGRVLIRGVNGDIAIPNSVTDIGDYAFSSCSGLTSVTIPDGVTRIGVSAFAGCSGLSSVTIPDSVTRISDDSFESCEKLWSSWYKALANISAGGGSIVVGAVQSGELPYALTNAPADRAIASVTVDGNCAIDSFVLKDGKVYDSVLYINNVATCAVTLTLPSGYTYKAIKGVKPLVLPANSQSILSITRVADDVFLVAREELETIQ